MICKHNWELLSTEVTQSELELVLSPSGKSPQLMSLIKTSGDIKVKGYSSTRKHIQTFTCKKCGELKRYVEDI